MYFPQYDISSSIIEHTHPLRWNIAIYNEEKSVWTNLTGAQHAISGTSTARRKLRSLRTIIILLNSIQSEEKSETLLLCKIRCLIMKSYALRNFLIVEITHEVMMQYIYDKLLSTLFIYNNIAD